MIAEYLQKRNFKYKIEIYDKTKNLENALSCFRLYQPVLTLNNTKLLL